MNKSGERRGDQSAAPNLPNNTGENKDNITGSSHLQFPNRKHQQRCTTSNNLHIAYKEGQHSWARRCERTSSITSQPDSVYTLMLSGHQLCLQLMCRLPTVTSVNQGPTHLTINNYWSHKLPLRRKMQLNQKHSKSIITVLTVIKTQIKWKPMHAQ